MNKAPARTDSAAKLSWKQRAEMLAAFIEEWKTEHGKPPTTVEIIAANAEGKLHGFGSTSAIARGRLDIANLRAEALDAQHGDGYHIQGDT